MKRRRFGQHYLIDKGVILRMLQEADIQPVERVVEIGTGTGILTKELVGLGRSFKGYEIDPVNHSKTAEAIGEGGGELILGDAFEEDPDFDVLVASLPYSQSGRFIEWISERIYDRAVVLLQKDFVDKIRAQPGTREYRGISVLAQISSWVKPLARVGPSSFFPPPKVGSVLVRFSPKLILSPSESKLIKRIFSLRRRNVTSVLAALGIDTPEGYKGRRVFTLTPGEVHALCKSSNALTNPSPSMRGLL